MSSSRQHDDHSSSFDDLTKALADSFGILADEVQLLSDRKTILEHKLRFAHEQYQQLADRYAPDNSDIAHTLAALQVPPDLQIQTPDRATFVPLPLRRPAGSKQQTAEAIRDGRKVSRLIARLRGWVPTSESCDRSTIQSTIGTMRTSARGTPTTILEQDFTVPGKLSKLDCPFTSMASTARPIDQNHRKGSTGSLPRDTTPHQSADPICAAMYSETHSSAPPSVGGAVKCPIRFMDQHSPEEVAQYFETHKHEIPRSHEVCVKRYQRNEEDIRKLDAKYGNMVSMIQGLGAKHQPMLPVSDIEEPDDVEVDAKSNRRIESWAEEINTRDEGDQVEALPEEDDREGRFDRPLREVRVGESPSRPWGISVPYIETPAVEPEEFARPVFPLETKLLMDDVDAKPVGKCPFSGGQKPLRPLVPQVEDVVEKSAGKCPFSAAQNVKPASPGPVVEKPVGKCPFDSGMMAKGKAQQAEKPTLPDVVPPLEEKVTPTFLQPKDITGPQVVFNGPVFIGYTPDQAMVFMKEWQKGMKP